MTFITPRSLGALSLACLVTACEIDPEPAPRRHALADETRAVLVDYPDVQAQLAGSLTMLFGSPSDPRFLLTSDWADEAFDPNFPHYPAGDWGSGDVDEAQWEEIVAGNERRFADQLAAIEAREYDDVPPVRNAEGLNASYARLLDERGEFEDEEEFHAEAVRTFAEYYPTLRESAEMYRTQCQHCHGVSGGGDGPTAPYLDPPPRDYRQGIFKWTAVADKAQPRREDLYEILHQGVYMTAMPSFARFSPAELHGLVDYVRLLAMRGQVERLLRVTWEDGDPITPELVQETYTDVWDRWLGADEKLIAFEGEVPEATPERIAQGRELFMDAKKGNCFSCHGDRGLGDGASAKEEDPETGELAWVLNEWGQPAKPRNLRQGLYRGGHRPIDIYRRVYAGINGTPMPASSGILTEDEIWSVVHYVRSLSEAHDGQGLRPWRDTTASHGDAHDAGHQDTETGALEAPAAGSRASSGN